MNGAALNFVVRVLRVKVWEWNHCAMGHAQVPLEWALLTGFPFDKQLSWFVPHPPPAAVRVQGASHPHKQGFLRFSFWPFRWVCGGGVSWFEFTFPL